VAWFALYVVGTAVGSFISPFLKNRFPLNLIKGAPGEPRALLFPRNLFCSAIFGGIFGLFCGWAFLTTRLVLPHLFSK